MCSAIWDGGDGGLLELGMSTRGEATRGTCPVRVQAWIPSLLAPLAHHSLQGCLAGVRASMYLQVVLSLEGFATSLTGEFTDT